VEKYREDSKAKDRILRKLNIEEIKQYEKDGFVTLPDKEFSLHRENSTDELHLMIKLNTLIEEVMTAKPQWNMRPRKFVKEYLIPILESDS